MNAYPHPPSLFHVVCLHLVEIHQRAAEAQRRTNDLSFNHRAFLEQFVLLVLEALRRSDDPVRFCFQTRFFSHGSEPDQLFTLDSTLEQAIEAGWLLGTAPTQGRNNYQLTGAGRGVLAHWRSNPAALPRTDYSAKRDFSFPILADRMEQAARPYLQLSVGELRQAVYRLARQLRQEPRVPCYALA